MTALVLVVAAGLYALRLYAPDDLADNAQEQPIGYALDIVQNHHWIVQWDANGDIASKPPLLNWLVALSALALGGFNVLSVTLIPALSTAALAVLLLYAGTRLFSFRAGAFAALMYLFCPVALKQVTLVRADGLFALCIAAAALLALHAWHSGKGWTAAWVAAAFATLAKGPLALLIVLLGFAAVWWEQRTHAGHPVRGSHRRGIILFLLIAGGWFALGLIAAGDALPRKIIMGELVHHAVTSGKRAVPFEHVHQPPLYFLAWFGPWSLMTLAALWRVWRRPEQDAPQRRSERFLFCWFLLGLAIFAASPHQRPDLLWPIVPAAALLAGRHLDQAVSSGRMPGFALSATATAALLITGAWIYCMQLRPKDDGVQQSEALRRIATEVKAALGDGIHLTFANGSPVLQMYLGACTPHVGLERAAKLLSGKDTAFVVVNNLESFQQRYDTNAQWHVVAEGPKLRAYHTAIFSNHPRLERTHDRVVGFGDVVVRLHDVERFAKRGDVMLFVPRTNSQASVALVNDSSTDRSVRVLFNSGAVPALPQSYSLAAGDSMTVEQAN